MTRKQIKAHWFLWVIIAASFIITLALYNKLPEQMPMHWNLTGEVDRYETRLVGAFAIPVLNVFLLLMMIWMPVIDPRRKNYDKFEGFYKLFQWVMVLFLTGMHVLTLSWSLGYEPSISMFVKLGMGILFMILGNYMGKTRANWFIGIRTPWTIENEEVWNKTHRLGGVLMFLAGLIAFLLAFINQDFTFWITIGAILAAAIVPVVYSFLLFQKLAK